MYIPPRQLCDLTHKPIRGSDFYAFGCGHCVTAEAATAHVIAHTPNKDIVDQISRLQNEIRQVASMSNLDDDDSNGSGREGRNAGIVGTDVTSDGPSRLESLKSQLDDLVASDCPICGDLLVQTVTEKFIDRSLDTEEILAWALPLGH